MKKNGFSRTIHAVNKTFDKHSPEILLGIGIAGVITTTITAVRSTPKALILIDDEKRRRNQEVLDKVEVIKITWKCYIPTITTGIFTIMCFVGANSVNAKRNAALATACKLSETAFTEYQEKVIETIGEKKEKTVRDNIAKDHVDRNPASTHEIIMTDKGETLCYDYLSGRYFKSDIDKIRKVENILNKRLINELYISLNDFYYELGLSGNTIGDDLGWSVEDGLIELDFSTQLSDDDTPCLVVNFDQAPKYNYQKIL